MAFQVVSYQVTAAGLETEAAGLKVEKEEVAILVVVKKEEVAKVAVVKKEEVGWVEVKEVAVEGGEEEVEKE